MVCNAGKCQPRRIKWSLAPHLFSVIPTCIPSISHSPPLYLLPFHCQPLLQLQAEDKCPAGLSTETSFMVPAAKLTQCCKFVDWDHLVILAGTGAPKVFYRTMHVCNPREQHTYLSHQLITFPTQSTNSRFKCWNFPSQILLKTGVWRNWSFYTWVCSYRHRGGTTTLCGMGT